MKRPLTPGNQQTQKPLSEREEMGVGPSEASHYLLVTISLHVWNRYVPNTKHTHTQTDTHTHTLMTGSPLVLKEVRLAMQPHTLELFCGWVHGRAWLRVNTNDHTCLFYSGTHWSYLHCFRCSPPKRFNTRKNVLVNTKYLSMGLYLPLCSANMQWLIP